MQILLTVAARGLYEPADVLVLADDGAMVGDLARELAAAVAANGPAGRPGAAPGSPDRGYGVTLYVDGVPAPADAPLAGSPIRDGVVVGIDDPALCPATARTVPLEVRVAGGPDAGGLFPLEQRWTLLGSGGSAHIRIADPALAPEALWLETDEDGRVHVQAAAPGTAPESARSTGPGQDGGQAGELPPTATGASTVLLDRSPVAGPQLWQPGGLLTVGGSVFELGFGSRLAPRLPVSADGSGLIPNRLPRTRPPVQPKNVRLPDRPARAERHVGRQMFSSLLPLAASLLGVLVTGDLRMLYLAAISPAWFVMILITSRRQRKRDDAEQARIGAAQVRERQSAAESAFAEGKARRVAFPDPGTVLITALGPGPRLWERRPDSEDFLELRLGIADLPATTVTLTAPAGQTPNDGHGRVTVPFLAPDAPATVHLARCGVLGVAGPVADRRALARWLVAQTAVLHSPQDVAVYILTDRESRPDWAWTLWLPQLRARGRTQALVRLGNDHESVGARVEELGSLVKERAQGGGRDPGQRAEGTAVVLLDGARGLREQHPDLKSLLKDGPAAQVYFVCLDDAGLSIPECAVVAAFDDDRTLRIEQDEVDPIPVRYPDLVAPHWGERLARMLAPLRDGAWAGEGAAELPDRCRLLDLVGLEPSAESVARRWSDPQRGTGAAAVIGIGAAGRPFTLDLVGDGPHALVIGTTGSGKSELLQTLIGSLALNHRPDELTFALIEFKGQSAFLELTELPHLVGSITDLDKRKAKRAITALQAELARRKRVLAAAGAPELPGYTARRRRDPGLEPLPRLVVIVDEFSKVIEELPDAVPALADIAAQGRSLGIHLILATQKFTGTNAIPAKISSNTGVWIALRVQTETDSSDVIGRNDAYYIGKHTPGRAYIKLGAEEQVEIQSARVAGPRPTSGASATPVVRLPWSDLGRPPQLGEPTNAGPATGEPTTVTCAPGGALAAPGKEEVPVTDLSDLVDAMCAAVEAEGLAPPRALLLNDLPLVLRLGELTVPRPGPGGLVSAPIGSEEVLAEQRRENLALDLEGCGHLLVVGASQSGRSQLLRTAAASVAQANSCADVHIYAIDCGSGALGALRPLPHCGAVVAAAEEERAVRLLDALLAEIDRRNRSFGSGEWAGSANFAEQRRSADPARRLPAIMVLVDRVEVLADPGRSVGYTPGGTMAERVSQILRTGSSAGVFAVLAGDRSMAQGSAERQFLSHIRDKIALNLSSLEDFQSSINLPKGTVTEPLPPGRAYRFGRSHEIQIAVLGESAAGGGTPALDGRGQAEALLNLGLRLSARDAGVPAERRPRRIDQVPPKIPFDQAAGLPPVGMRDPGARPGALWALVGVGGNTRAGHGPDLATGGKAGFLIAGLPESGRSTALLATAHSLLQAGTELVLAAPKPSPLRAFAAGQPGVLHLCTQENLTARELKTALGRRRGPAVVLIDDAETYRLCDAADELTSLLDRRLGPGLGLIAACNCAELDRYSGWLGEAKKAGRGLLLNPADQNLGQIFGRERLPAWLLRQGTDHGLGVLYLGPGRPLQVRVPFWEENS
jgi:DNA segregation ATPase FtsK/SpoIIIE, S-DNA-T family